MRILITNDDGITAPGIRSLMKILPREHELIVIAPDRERSATGHSLTLHKPLRVKKEEESHNLRAWSSTGTPTDCIKLALCSFLEEKEVDKNFDVVITGINNGPNLGADILYSGTVNAAIEGAIYSIPSIAVSLSSGEEELKNFDNAAEFLLILLKKLPSLELPDNTVLNINYPPNTPPDIDKVRVSVLGKRMYDDNYEKRKDPRGKVYYWLTGSPIIKGEIPESDVSAVNKGYISLTPIHFNLTDKELIESLKDHF